MATSVFFLLLATVLANVKAESLVGFPGVEFNAAISQMGHASSYYDYSPNILLDTAFTPNNAIDGLVHESSWWSSGDNASEQVYWQLNMTSMVPSVSRLVIRWHGYLSPSQYLIRISYAGENFRTVAAITSMPIEYDRVDEIVEEFTSIDPRFFYLRIDIKLPNVCESPWRCSEDVTTYSQAEKFPYDDIQENKIYGIREVELWTNGYKNAASTVTTSYILYVLAVAVAWSHVGKMT